MAVFAYIYHQSFITPQSVSVEMILDQVKLWEVFHLFPSEHTLYEFFVYYIASLDLDTKLVYFAVDIDESQLRGATGIVHKACTDNSGEPIWKIVNWSPL